MRRIIYALLVMIVMASCQTENKNVAVVSGKVSVSNPSVKFEWFKQYSTDFHPIAIEAQIDSLNEFEVNIPIDGLTKGMMLIGNERYDLVLKPNESLIVNINNDTITFDGEGSDRNRFLYRLSKNPNGSKMQVFQTWYSKGMEFEDFFSYIDTYLETRDSSIILAQVLLKHDKEFVDYFNEETELDRLDLINHAPLAYSRMKQVSTDSMRIPAPYRNAISLHTVQNDDYLKHDAYLSFLNSIIHDHAMTLMAVDTSLTKDEATLSIIMDSLHGKTQEHYLVQTIYMKLSIYDECDSSFFMAFDSIGKNTNCIAVVEAEKDKYQKKKAMLGAPLHADFLSTIVYDTANNELTLKEVFANSAQKVLYLDIWSLGCGPCRMAMPHSKKLKEELKEESIEFIYLTVDNYSDELWNEVFEVSLTQNNHYRFAKGFSAKMLKLFNTMAVPTYMIIDKQGHLVSYKADRPLKNGFSFNEELVEQLRELSKK